MKSNLSTTKTVNIAASAAFTIGPPSTASSLRQMSSPAPTTRGGSRGSSSSFAATSWKRGAKHGGADSGSAPSAEGKSQRGQVEAPPPGASSKKSHGGGGYLDLAPAAAPIVDIGLNLCHKSFKATVRDIVSRALDKGVTRMVITGTSLSSSEAAVAMTRDVTLSISPDTKARSLYATAGVHPHDAKQWTPGTRSKIIELQRDPACVAVGECGLDFNRNYSPPDVQEAVFEEQVRIAVDLGKPLFCHEREAHSKFLEVLGRLQGLDPRRVCVHCFTGDRSELEVYVKMGFFIGFTGCICDEKRGKALRKLVPIVPLSQLMIETDAPFMMPTGGRGRNEPSNLPAILRTVAECHGVGEDDAARATTANAVEFFRLLDC